MIDALLGLTAGLPAMWLFGRLARRSELLELKSQQRALMKAALRHTGNFVDLLAMQRRIIVLSLAHLRMVLLPALVSCAPIILLLALRPEFATLAFFIGIVVAYAIAKWRWGI